MKWSSAKFQSEMNRRGISYEDLAERLIFMGWVSIREFVVLQLRGFAHGIAPARLRDCADIADAMGVPVTLLLDEDLSAAYSSGAAVRLNYPAESRRLSA